MSDDKNEGGKHYEVGYGKPPKAHQFKHGQSGNPKGRPKGSKNLHGILKRAAMQTVVVTEKSGRRRAIPKIEAAAVQLNNQAAAGSLPAIRLAIELLGRVEQLNQAKSNEMDPAALRASDAAILKSLKSRLVAGDPPSKSESEGS